MKDKDKELVKSSAIVTADSIAVGVDAVLGGTPLMSGAWGLTKALFGAGIKLRQNKAIEWVEMVRDNPSVFTKELLETREFQDAFTTSFESYIKERSSDKRILLRAIFKDYSSVKDPQNYPLERLYDITNQITFVDAKNFSQLYQMSSEDSHRNSITGDFGKSESTYHLIYLGLLAQDIAPRYINENQTVQNPRVFVSGLGRHYKKFIEEIDLK